MAFIRLYKEKLKHNYNHLNTLFKENNIDWAIVTKLLCGHEEFLKEVINLGAKEFCDSRISNLKTIKEINPDVSTVYIKPPAKRAIKSVVQYADASFNTEYETIKLLSKEAGKQNKLHNIIIMIEMGDLREGVIGDELVDFYGSVFELPNIKVTGIGTNLNCLHGVMPSQDKLVQLSLYKQLIEAKFNRKIPWVTGGTSVVIPLLMTRQLPKGINHFRVGEMLYFGNNLFTAGPVEELKQDVIKLYAEVIELSEKPVVPNGVMEANPSGEVYEINEDDYGKTSYRAIIDLGLLDVSTDFLTPDDPTIEISGASSDMIVLDIGENKQGYKVGDLISFDIQYMGALALLNSDYIGKELI